MKLYQTNKNINWFIIDKNSYSGISKDDNKEKYTLKRNQSFIWILEGPGEKHKSQYRHDLMERVS